MKHAAAILPVLTLAALFLAPAPPAAAQTWVPVGPPGGDVRSLGADPRNPQRLYLGTADGVMYRSDDAGLRWTRLSPGFPLRGQSIDDILVSPTGALIVGYWEVSGSGGGVATSTDGGNTFQVLPGIAGQSVRAITMSQSNPSVVVAGTIGGVFRSTDFGRSWARITPEGHEELRNVESVAIDPTDPRVVYAGTWHLPWKTTDAGATWAPIQAGMIDDSDVFTVTVDRRDPKVLYATACSGIYRSTDAAGRWARIRGIPASSRRTRAFAQDADRPSTLYAGTTEGLWVSDDDSVTWRPVTQKNLVINAVLALPGGLVLLGSDGAGVVRSSDGGRTFAASNQGFSERFVSRMVYDSGAHRWLVSIWADRQHSGVMVAPGPAGPWRKLAPGLEGREVLSVAVAGNEVLAGTDDGLFLSNTAASSWVRLPVLLAGADAHPRVHDVAVLGNGVMLAATSRGLVRSGDWGQSWTAPFVASSGSVAALAVAPSDPSLVMLASPLGFFRSTDAGLTWVQVSGALADGVPSTLEFLPGSQLVAFAATRNGLFRTVDQGRSWRLLGSGIPASDITGLAMHPDGRTIYASDFTFGGIFRSADAGNTWRRMPATGLVSERVWAVGLDPSAPDRVLAASPAGGLHLLVPPAPASGTGAP